jgi:hypothetical protein
MEQYQRKPGLIRQIATIAGGTRMRWVLAVSVAAGLATLARAFFLNARMIRRDLNRRFDALGDRLEQSAMSLVDGLLKTNRVADPDSRRD